MDAINSHPPVRRANIAMRHARRICTTSSDGRGYAGGDHSFSRKRWQESRMRSPLHSTAESPHICTTGKSFLSIVLSIVCTLTLAVDLPALAAPAPAAKDKKAKQDPVLKGLPVTELTADE